MSLLSVLGNAARGINPEIDRYREKKERDQMLEQSQSQQMDERNFASAFSKSLISDDLAGATQVFDQFRGKVSPQTLNSARQELQKAQQAKKQAQVEAQQAQQQAQTQSENMRTMAPAMAQGATAEEAQMLADAGRAGSGLDAIMGVRKNVQGREQQAQLQQQDDDVKRQIQKATLMQKLAEAKKMQDGGGKATPTAPKISTTTQQKIDSLLSVNDEAANLIKQLDNPKLQEYLGPYAGRIANISNSMGAGDLPDEVVNFRSGLYDMVDLWLRERTGAAVTADEVERAMTEIIGGPTTNPNALRTRLKRMAESNAQRINRLSQGTIDVDEPDEVLARDGSSEGPKFNPQTGRYE